MAWAEAHRRGFRGIYRDQNERKHKTKTFPSKRAALQAARDEEAKIRAGQWHDPSAGKMLLDDYFFNHWLPNRVIELNTQATYVSHYNASIRDTFGQTEVRKITSAAVQRWVVAMTKEGASPGTVRARFVTLQTCLGATRGVSAVRDKLIAENPCTGVTLPTIQERSPDVYAPGEVSRLSPHLDPWWLPIVVLAAESGARWGELLGLRVRDFDTSTGTIIFHRTIVEVSRELSGTGSRFVAKPYPKSKKARSVRVDPAVAQMLSTLIKARQLFPEDRLFSMPDAGTGNSVPEGALPLRTAAWPSGTPVGRAFFRRSVWLPAHAAADVRPRRFHDLRGSHISWLLAGGADIASVRQRAGHANLATTQVYVGAMDDAETRLMAALRTTKERA